MRKLTIIFMGLAVLSLSACSAFKHDIAKMQNKNLVVKMPNGSPVHYNTNLTPTSNWGCHSVGQSQQYDWKKFQLDSKLHFGSPMQSLAKSGVSYLSSHGLKANYMNLRIPEDKKFNLGVTGEVFSWGLGPKQIAHVDFYQCKKINPSLDAGNTQHASYGVDIE